MEKAPPRPQTFYRYKLGRTDRHGTPIPDHVVAADVCDCTYTVEGRRPIAWRLCRDCGGRRPVDRWWLLSNPNSKVLHPDDVAALVGQDVAWVLAKAKAGRAPVVVLSKRIFRIFRDELPAWQGLAGRTRKATKPLSPDHLERLSDTGVVYFIQAVNGGPIKIGTAIDPKKRLASLQLSCPFRLKILATRPGGERLERSLHRRFAAYRLHGEWFEPNTPGLRQAMRRKEAMA
jgi:hypothetical protein